MTQLEQIISCNSKCLIINGGHRAGKFYMACKKAIAMCEGNKNFRFAIFCDCPKYAVNVLKELCSAEYNLLTRSFCFGNGSFIDVIKYEDFIKSSYHSAILKSVDYVSKDIFDSIDRCVTGQVIFTCNPPDLTHWLRDVFNTDDCFRIDITMKH